MNDECLELTLRDLRLQFESALPLVWELEREREVWQWRLERMVIALGGAGIFLYEMWPSGLTMF